MQDFGLGEYKSINAYVAAKTASLKSETVSFATLFEKMFSEKDNILYERSAGYRVETTTYGQAREEALRLAGAVKAALPDAAQNAVVGLAMNNSVEWIELFWAILAAGFCPLLVNLRLPQDAVERALCDAGAAAVISEERQYSVLTIRFSDLPAAEPLVLPAAFGEELWIMSSGTSEHIKLCAYSAQEFYYQILSSYQIIRQCKAIKQHTDGKLKLLTFLPFYHVFGLIAVYIWFAFFSRTFVHLEDMAPRTIVNTVKRHRVTHIFAVPLFWEKVYEQAMRTVRARGEEEKLEKGLRIARVIGDVPLIGKAFIRKAFAPVREQLFGESIRFLITGGSMISKEALSFFNLIGYPLANGYGMTEIGITSVELSGSCRVRSAAFIGKPLAGVEYAISEQGDLLVRGKVMARRVMIDGQLVPREEWFHTQDLAECVRGRYRLLGRRDDVVIASDGENLNPALLEPAFAGEDIAGAALLGVRQDESVEPVLLVSVSRALTSARFEALQARVRETAQAVGLAKSLKKIVFVTDPLMEAEEFKLNRACLARRLAKGEFTVASGESFADTLQNDDPRLARVREMFAFALGKESGDVRDNADFFLDEGGTSLDYFALISALQEEFSVAFPTQEGKSLNSVAALYTFLCEGDHAD